MPQWYKQIVILGIAGMLTALRGVGLPPAAPPPAVAGAEMLRSQNESSPQRLVNAEPQDAPTILVTDTLTITGEAQGQSDGSESRAANQEAPAPRSFAVPDATATPTPTSPKPPGAPAAVPTQKPIAHPAPACGPIGGQSYGAMNVRGGPADRPAAAHADLNLGLRGWVQVNQPLSLINVGGPTDDRSPRFPGLFGPRRMPRLTVAYQVYNWDFGRGRRTAPLNNPAVTLLGFAAAPGEIIHLPNAAYDIGNGYAALVLYAEPGRLTLKYTREDNVAVGYTLHLEGVCVEPRLLSLYRTLNVAGRRQLPAVRNGQPLGIALGGQIIAGIQDSGTWMDPRSRKDWW